MPKIKKTFKHLRDTLLSLLEAMSVSERVIFGAFAAVLIISALLLLKNASDVFALKVPAEGGTITEGVEGYPRYINPLLPITDAGRDLTKLLYAGLMKVGTDGSIVPDMAESLKISDDGLIYTVALKDGLLFHDSVPVTAYDVEFTVKRATDPILKSPRAADWSGVGVKALDAKTIEFSLKKPYAPFIDNLTLGILPEHIWRDVGSDAFLFSEFNFEPVGSGPYKIKDVRRNASGLPAYYHFVSWDEYSSGKPYITDIFVHFYPNEEELIRAYREGDVDSINSVSPANASTTDFSRSTIINVPLPRFYAVFLNQNQAKIFADKSVRQALSLAAPRKEIIEQVLLGYGSTIESPLPKAISATGEIESDAEGFKRAQNLLTSAGWSIASSTGALTQKAKKGSPSATLSFALAVPDVPELKATAEMLKVAWEKLGIKVNIEIFDSSDLEQNVIVPRKFDALLFGESIGRSADLFAFWHSSERKSPGLNIAEYANSKADKLLEQARATSDDKKRNDLYQQFEKEILADTPAIFLYAPEFVYAVPKGIEGIVIEGISDASERFANVNLWYLETESVWPIFGKY